MRKHLATALLAIGMFTYVIGALYVISVMDKYIKIYVNSAFNIKSK